ncbi:MAG: hypothetical protein JRF72_08175, partial [Deltaproteobacteria bacterium]|nr:hypothetical protein [Deltaproteobacteria bacterium]
TKNLKKGSPLKAIVIGLVIDIGGSFLSAFILAIAYGVLLASRGLSPEEIEYHLVNLDPYSTFYIITMAVGGLMTVLGGYVCARMVNYTEYKFAFIFGFISAALGHIIRGSYHSTLDNLALGILTIGCALLGAWLRVVQKANAPV